MSGPMHKGKLDIEIDNKNKQLKEIEEANAIYESLENDENELKEHKANWFFIRWFQVIAGIITTLEKRIEETKNEIQRKNLRKTPKARVEEFKDTIKKLECARDERKVDVQWEGFPERLDEEIQEEYLNKIKTLPETIDDEIENVNITMVGGVGVGKSSFLNTVVTALMNDPTKTIRDYKTALSSTGKSKTKKFQLYKLRVEGKKDIPIKFYDCPGLSRDEDKTMTLDMLEAVIKGHVKADSRFNTEAIRIKDENSYRRDPSFKHAMHCIVFVIKATTNIKNPHDKILAKIKEIQKRIDDAGDAKQVAIVTYIDESGVPDVDMENVFKYKCIKEVCKDVAEFLEIELQSVYPVSNYHAEKKPSVAKNALALMALWDIIENGKEHIEKKLEEGFRNDD